MNKRVWIFQHKKDVVKKGADAASWYVGWYDLRGKRHSESCGPGSRGAPATINKDLRHIKAALRLAREWNYLPEVPKIRMVKEPQKLPTYVTPEHFDLIYNTGCELAKLPDDPGRGYTPAEWWKAL